MTTNSTFGKPVDKAETERIEAIKEAQREKEFLLTVLTPDMNWEGLLGNLTFYCIRQGVPIRYKPSNDGQRTVAVFIKAADSAFLQLKKNIQKHLGVIL